MPKLLATPLLLLWFAFAALGLLSVGEEIRCHATQQTCINDPGVLRPALTD